MTDRPTNAAPGRRRSLRLRLTAVYTLLFLACGTLLLGITYALVEHATGKDVVYTSPDGRSTISLSNQDGVPSDKGGKASAPTNSGTGGPPPPADDASTLRSLALQQHADSMHQLLLQGGVALGLATLASGGLSWYLAGRTLRPLRTMITTVRDISATSLHRRLALAGPPDELTELGDTFDALLGRLEGAFEAQRQFVANASHELRTPLARQRAIGQVALGDPGATAESLRVAHEKILQSGRDQEQLIEALLDLARGQSDLQRRTDVDLAALVDRAVETRLADADGLTLTTALAPAITTGDPRLIERLVGNLLDNAIRHNLAGGHIDVATHQGPGGTVLVVGNTGDDVTDEDVTGFLEPFRRGVADRTDRGKGLGLGLPIVQAVARAHAARLDIRPRTGGGVRVEIDFPPAARV